MKHALAAFTAASLLIPIAAVHAQVACQKVFQSAPGVGQLTPQVMGLIVQGLRQVNPEVLNLRASPKWQDFEALSQLLGKLERGDLAEAPLDVPTVARFREILSKELDIGSTADDRTYLPTEFELQTEFRAMLVRLNDFLPTKLQLRVPRLRGDARPELTARQAADVMGSIRRQFERLFPTTGHADLKAYREAVRAQDNPELQQAFDLLDRGEFELSIRRPENGRFWIPKVGFHNQFVTGGSKGYYTPSGRNHAEASWTGIPLETYEALNAEAKPKYGSIRPLPSDSGSRPGNSESFYGPDVFILKTQKLKDRLTFNLGDSNGLLAKNNKTGQRWEEVVNQAQSWDQSFIPWSHRTLLAPYLDRQAFGRPTRETAPVLKKSWEMDYIYFEIQIFGELTLNDVKAFEFTRTPPSGEFLRELREHGIEIRNGRTWPSRVWTEDLQAAAPEASPVSTPSPASSLSPAVLSTMYPGI